jgi:hypothetical protein
MAAFCFINIFNTDVSSLKANEEVNKHGETKKKVKKETKLERANYI